MSTPEHLELTMRLPFVEYGSGYVSRRLDVMLKPDQAETLRALRFGLMHSGVRTANGVEVQTNRDVIRWMLERIAEARRDDKAKERKKGRKR